MTILKKYGFAIFWILATADILLIVLEQEQYRVATKPLLIPALLVTVLARVGFTRHRIPKVLMIAAFLFATAGDVFLLFDGNATWFIAGLVSFLIMQLLYSIYFLRIKPFRFSHIISILASFLLVAFVSGAIAYKLWNNLGEFRIPLIVYSIFLAFMFTSAVNVYHYRVTNKLALEAFIPGAALFVLSDLILAVNMFYLKEAFIGIAVMATYCGAQYYIARGFIKHLK